MSNEVKSIIKKLRNYEINCFDIPEEYRNEKIIIDVERKLGIRKLGRRGYDVIKNVFFVEEEFINNNHTKKQITYFDKFESYSVFVEDKIYDNACYYECDISKIGVNVDCGRLYEKKSFVENTIDDYTATSTDEEINFYNKGEQIKTQCKSWIDKFNACLTADEFRKVEQNYRKSKLSTELVWRPIYI